MRIRHLTRGTFLTAAVAALLGMTAHSQAALVTVSETTMTDAYMSWTPLPGNTVGGASASGWGISALDASFNGAGNTVTVSGNTNIADSVPTSTYWFINGNVNDPGQLMDANLYCEVDNITDLNWTFNYNVLSNTFQSPIQSSNAFIKAFAPGYAYIGEVTATLTPGLGSLVLNPTVAGFGGLADGDIIQYGFETVGPDLTDAAAAAAGNAVITAVAVPEPATVALVVGALALFARRRRSA